MNDLSINASLPAVVALGALPAVVFNLGRLYRREVCRQSISLGA